MVNPRSALIIATAAFGTASALVVTGVPENARDLRDSNQVEARTSVPITGAEGVLPRAFVEDLEARQAATVVKEVVDVAKKAAPAVGTFRKAAAGMMAAAAKAWGQRDLEDDVRRSEIESILSRAFAEELEARQAATVVKEVIDVAKKAAPPAATLERAAKGIMAAARARMRKQRDLEGDVRRSETESILSRAFAEELEARQAATVIKEVIDVAKKAAPAVGTVHRAAAGMLAAVARLKKQRDLEGDVRRSETESILSRAFAEELEARQAATVVKEVVDVAKKAAPAVGKFHKAAAGMLAAVARLKKQRDLEGDVRRSEIESILSGIVARDGYRAINDLD